MYKPFVFTFIFFLIRISTCFCLDYDLSFECMEEFTVRENYLYDNSDEFISALIDKSRVEDGQYIFDKNFNTYGNKYFDNIVILIPEIRFTTGNDIRWHASVYMSSYYYKNNDNSSDADIELLQAYFFKKNRNGLIIKAGYLPFIIGKGWVLYNNEPGIDISYKIAPHYYLNFQTVILFNKSPFFSANIEYRRSLFDKLILFGSYLKDNDSKISEMLNHHYFINQPENQAVGHFLVGLKTSSEIEDQLYFGSMAGDMVRMTDYYFPNYIFDLEAVSNTGDIFWAGLVFNFFIGPLYITGTSAFQFGNYQVTTELTTLKFERTPPTSRWQTEKKISHTGFDISAYLADIDLNYRINDFFSAGVFLCISSGDLEPGQGTFTEYFAPVPYHFRAPVFFEGLGTLGDPETLSLIGVFKPGVIAPGIKLSFEKNDNILIHLNITCIYPEKTETGGNTTLYGVETDLSIQYKITNSLEFTTDAGYLVYDTYFENNGKIPDPAGKFGIKLFFMF